MITYSAAISAGEKAKQLGTTSSTMQLAASADQPMLRALLYSSWASCLTRLVLLVARLLKGMALNAIVPVQLDRVCSHWFTRSAVTVSVAIGSPGHL